MHNCKVCSSPSISVWSVLRNNRFRPHVCSICGTESYISSNEKFKEFYVSTFLFWPIVICSAYFDLVGVVILPAFIFSSYLSFKLTIGRPNAKRTYLKLGSINNNNLDQGSKGQTP